MPTPRAALAAVCVGQYILAIGGWTTGGERLNTVECYDPEQNRWTAVAPMQSSRKRFGAVALDGKVFVAAGEGGVVRHEKPAVPAMECYDPEHNTWTGVGQSLPEELRLVATS